MQRLQINNTVIEIPASFNEFTGDQLLFLTRCAMYQEDEFTLRLKTAFFCAGLKFGSALSEAILPDGEKVILSQTDIWFIASCMNFLFSKEGKIHSQLFLQRIPFIIMDDAEWHGPADALGNLRWDEFILTQTHYGRFLLTAEEKYLHQLAAVLYRPHSGADPKAADFGGDVREPLNAYLTEERANMLIENQPPEFMMTVLWFYAGCLEFINKEFPGVLSDPKAAEEKATETHSTANSTDPFDAMMELTDVLCNEDVTSVEKVRSSNLYDVLRRLKNAKAKQKMQKEQAEKLKNKR